jgi:apolipoprotein N-acyltransferase
VTRIPDVALAALSGALLALSFPKFGNGLVAWVALAPLLLALSRSRGGLAAFRLGYVTGAVAAVGIVYWTALVVVQFGGLSLPVGIAVMALLCLALALFPSLFAWMVGTWVRAVGPPALLLAPLAWVATEILRAHTLLRFAWCLLGYSQHDNLAFVQVARFTAVYGVSFLVAAVSAVLAYMGAERRPGPRRAAGLALAALLGACWAYGAWLLRQPEPERGRLKVGLVQASIVQDDKWDPDKAWQNVEHHLELTRRAAADGARLVVWPESSAPFYFDHSEAFASRLRELAAREGIYLLFGNDDRERAPEARYYVGAKLLAPDGALRLRYHKVRLVPFGEYVPLQPVLTLGGRHAAKLVRQVADFTPGTEAAVGEVDGYKVGASICYEAIFADFVRQFAVRGTDLLANLTNDGWYGRTSAPYQHLAMVRFRAVENGRYLVRAANTGFSAVVDSRGRVLARTELFERTYLVREVPLVTGTTFYARYGDVFAWACFGAAVAFTASVIAKRRRGATENTASRA